ncbi:DUF3108 domain-containing protein [Chitinimonas sp.]|uniref:DUF3108 domain-containing protein n=1 Tax=Chitinimonas sp. TaxID=1934313 RepID=UPI0035AE12A9
MPYFLILLISLAGLLVCAEPLPARVHISYQARLGSLPIGRAEQRWQLDGAHYTLNTELTPILGPRIRYISHGDIAAGGLVPLDYAEYRNNETTPRRFVRFDWAKQQASFGNGDAQETAALEAGAQELNTLPFQLAWLGDKAQIKMQIATGRKLRHDSFTSQMGNSLTLRGKQWDARSWRSGEGEDRTEVWLAPGLANLPIKIIRSDEHGELQLVAQSIDIEPEKP